MSGYFPQPLRLEDYPRASSALPSSPSAAAGPSSSRDSPSPNKKRRVESVPPSTVASAGKPKSSNGSSSSSRAARIAEEQELLNSRLHSTLRLRDAWADILRRHSLPPPASSSPSSSHGRPPSSTGKRRHQPAGWTRAIPMEEDDIIDLSTMEIVEDRGVLRNSRKGAFAIGGYAGTLGDVIVGPDTGAEGGQGEEGEEDEEEDEDEVDWEEPDDGASDSDDELGRIDDLPSLPSLLFREERRKEAERKKELEDFWAQEAQSRGADGEAVEREEARERGNERLNKPLAGEKGGEDDLDLFASPLAKPAKPSSSSSVATPSRRHSASAPPPSTTAAIRKAIQTIDLTSPPDSPSSSASPNSSPLKPASKKAARSSSSAVPRASTSGLATPPTSFASSGRRSQPPPSQSKPRSSSSPLKNVVVIASRSPSPELGVPPRAISPELFGPPPVATAHHQNPTPTPTPPPPAPKAARPPIASTSAQKPPQPFSLASSAAARTSVVRKKRQHSFELIIDVPARPRAKSVAVKSTPPKKKVLAAPTSTSAARKLPPKMPASKSMPSLAALAAPARKADVKGKGKADEPAPTPSKQVKGKERAVERDVDEFDTGLSTPPLSKGSTSGKAVRRASAPPAPRPVLEERVEEEEEEEDEFLLLPSPVKPLSMPAKGTPRRTSVAPMSSGRKSDSRGPTGRKRRMSVPPGMDSESDDELMLM
ncbi:hypothetical protein JCM8097_007152 [Rhodosporidiobolus ruineniae]